MCFLVAPSALLQLLLETAALLFRIVELAEGIADLKTTDEDFKALDPILRLVALVLRQRRDGKRKVIEDGRLNQMLFGDRLKQRRDGFAHGLGRIIRHVAVVLVEPL